MNSPFPCPWSSSRRTLPYPDRLGHPQVGEGVQDRRPEVGFVHLPFEGSRVQAVAELLEPLLPVFGNAASMVTALVLPTGESLGFDCLEKGVAWWDRSTRVPLGDRRMAAVAVVDAISRRLREIAFDLMLHPDDASGAQRGGKLRWFRLSGQPAGWDKLKPVVE